MTNTPDINLPEDDDAPTCYFTDECEAAAIILVADEDGDYCCPECAAIYVIDDDGELVLG